MLNRPTRQQVCDTVVAAFREVVGVDPPHGLDTDPEHLTDWGSLAQIRLVHAIEQDLGCLLDERFLTTGHPLGDLVDAACAAANAGGDP